MTTIFLTKLFGIYFILVGLVVILRRGSLLPIIREIMANRSLLFVLGAAELIAGLALVLVYPEIGFTIPGILSVIGWMLVVEGVLYMLLPLRKIKKMVASFNKPSWYLSGGVLSVALGGYLTASGFGWF